MMRWVLSIFTWRLTLGVFAIILMIIGPSYRGMDFLYFLIFVSVNLFLNLNLFLCLLALCLIANLIWITYCDSKHKDGLCDTLRKYINTGEFLGDWNIDQNICLLWNIILYLYFTFYFIFPTCLRENFLFQKCNNIVDTCYLCYFFAKRTIWCNWINQLQVFQILWFEKLVLIVF